MKCFTIIKVLEEISGMTVEAHVTNNEMLVTFNHNGRDIKHAFTEEEIEHWTVSEWASIAGDVKLKLKSER